MSSEMRYFPSSADDDDEQEPSGYPRMGSTPNIADRFADLLAPLSGRRRRGLIARLSVGYYEGWRPSQGRSRRTGRPGASSQPALDAAHRWSNPAPSSRIPQRPLVPQQDLRQLLAGVHVELRVDVPQVVLDCLRAQEHCRCGLPGAPAARQHGRDL